MLKLQIFTFFFNHQKSFKKNNLEEGGQEITTFRLNLSSFISIHSQ